MSDARIKIVGVTVAVLLHLIMGIALMQDSVIRILFPKPKFEKIVEKKSEPVMRIRLLDTPKPEPPKVAEKQRYNRTTSEQPQEKSKQAKFYGEHDTVAQSNTAVDPSAAPMPSVDGKKEWNYPSSASNFQDGNLEHDAVASKSQPQVPTEIPAPLKKVTKNQAESAKEVQPQMDAGKPLSGSSVPLVEYMDAINKLPSEIHNQKPVADLSEARKGKADQESEKDKRPKETAERKKAQEKVAKKPFPQIVRAGQLGFRPTTEASKAMGSISRRGGVSSHDTEATPLGKYKKSVHDSIAKEWYRRIGQNPDLIKPGALIVRWYVYDTGRIYGINVVRELQGSEIQKGMTIQSIASAKIPKMPSSLKSDLNGEPVEFSITFQF